MWETFNKGRKKAEGRIISVRGQSSTVFGGTTRSQKDN